MRTDKNDPQQAATELVAGGVAVAIIVEIVALTLILSGVV